MTVQHCDFCDQVRETSTNVGEFGTYNVCQVCLDSMLSKEVCRVIGHIWQPAQTITARDVERGRHYRYWVRKCGRCGKTHGEYTNTARRHGNVY